MQSRPADGWKIVDSEIVIETQHLRLRSDTIELPSGANVGPYYVRESRGFAVVFAITPDERVVLVRQYKHGIGRVVLELPAGGIDPGETALQCGSRELAEETGYVGAGEPELVGTYIFDPTGATTTYALYLVRDAQARVPQKFDATEDIAVELVSFADVRRYVCDGTIDVGIHIAAVYTVLDRLGKL